MQCPCCRTDLMRWHSARFSCSVSSHCERLAIFSPRSALPRQARASWDNCATISIAILQTLSLAFHQRARTGDLTMRVVNDVASMREAMVTALMPFAANVLILCGMAGVMLALDWRLALIAMAPLPLMALATVSLGARIQSVSRDQRKREGSVASTVTEALGRHPPDSGALARRPHEQALRRVQRWITEGRGQGETPCGKPRTHDRRVVRHLHRRCALFRCAVGHRWPPFGRRTWSCSSPI